MNSCSDVHIPERLLVIHRVQEVVHVPIQVGCMGAKYLSTNLLAVPRSLLNLCTVKRWGHLEVHSSGTWLLVDIIIQGFIDLSSGRICNDLHLRQCMMSSLGH